MVSPWVTLPFRVPEEAVLCSRINTASFDWYLAERIRFVDEPIILNVYLITQSSDKMGGSCPHSLLNSCMKYRPTEHVLTL